MLLNTVTQVHTPCMVCLFEFIGCLTESLQSYCGEQCKALGLANQRFCWTLPRTAVQAGMAMMLVSYKRNLYGFQYSDNSLVCCHCAVPS